MRFCHWRTLMAKILGIDASTQSLSAVVIDTKAGALSAEVSINFGQRLPRYQAPCGFVENPETKEVFADPCMWLEALEYLFKDLSAVVPLNEIEAVCGAAQQHGSVYLNRHWFQCLQLLNGQNSHIAAGQNLCEIIAPCLSRNRSPIWMDTSTDRECLEIAAAMGGMPQVCARSGSIAIERFTGPQIRKFCKNAPDAYRQTKRIHLVSSFLCSVLCGADAPMDTGDASGMNLLNIRRWQWDQDLLNATAPDLNKKLPQVVEGRTQAGVIAKYFVEKFRFKENTPILVFTGDNPSSLVGMGASSPGNAVISLGTSDTFFAAMPGLATDPDGFGHVFGNPEGGYMALQCFANGSLAREAVRNRFGYDWEMFARALRQTQPGNGSNRMLPFLRPEISPRITLNRFVLCGSPSFENWGDPDAAIRACVEAQCINMKLRSAWMQIQPNTIYLTGGASRDDGIAQIIADIFQKPVRRIQVNSSVALGAAIRAGHHCLGISNVELETAFCRKSLNVTQPQIKDGAYTRMLADFDRWIARCREKGKEAQ